MAVPTSRTWPVSGLLFCLFAASTSVSAQAWLFPRGEGSVSLSYQYIFVRNHFFSKGEVVDVGHVPSHAMTLDVDYSLTEKFAVRMAVPFVAAKYSGVRPHQLPADDGTYHSGFQDIAIDLRYNLMKRPAVLTPFFRVVIPSNNYAYFAHSAIGRNLREYHVGTNFGGRLTPIAPKAYLHARYSYAVVERILGIAPNRSNAEIQLGYFLTRRLSLLGQGQGMHAHAGVDHKYGVFHVGLPNDLYLHHDQLGKADLLLLGGGTTYQVNGTWVAFLSLGRAITGRNTHSPSRVVTLGLSRSFGSESSGGKAMASAKAAPEPHKSLVCTCLKTK